jgi:iron complex outermembrane receptor protein
MTIEGRQTTVDSKPPGQLNPIPTIITGDQDFQGIEMVLNWLVTDSVRLGFMTTVRDATVTWEEYYNADGELDGGEQPETSTNTDYTITVGWQPQIGRGDLDVRVDYIFNEDTSALDPNYVDPTEYPGFYENREELNARIGWTSEDGRYMAALWGKNLLDQKLLGGVRDISILFETPFTSVSAPRTYGVEFGVRF